MTTVAHFLSGLRGEWMNNSSSCCFHRNCVLKSGFVFHSLPANNNIESVCLPKRDRKLTIRKTYNELHDARTVCNSHFRFNADGLFRNKICVRIGARWRLNAKDVIKTLAVWKSACEPRMKCIFIIFRKQHFKLGKLFIGQWQMFRIVRARYGAHSSSTQIR